MRLKKVFCSKVSILLIVTLLLTSVSTPLSAFALTDRVHINKEKSTDVQANINSGMSDIYKKLFRNKYGIGAQNYEFMMQQTAVCNDNDNNMNIDNNINKNNIYKRVSYANTDIKRSNEQEKDSFIVENNKDKNKSDCAIITVNADKSGEEVLNMLTKNASKNIDDGSLGNSNLTVYATPTVITVPKEITTPTLITTPTVINILGTDTIINADFQLTSDTTFTNLYLNYATLDLNGHTLRIEGDLIQSDGALYVNGGQLYIAGDYRIQKKVVEADGTIKYTGSDGKLKMINESDYVQVGGSFVTQSRYDYSQYLTAGVLEVKGDFIQKEYLGSGDNFLATGTHKVVLSGNSTQTVSFDTPGSSDSTFNILVITKPIDTGYVFSIMPIWNTLIEMSADTQPPTKPTNLTVTSKTSTSASISWTGSTDNILVSKYIVYRYGEQIAATGGTNFTDTGLSPNTTYEYTVKAVDYNGNMSDVSDAVSVITNESTKPDWYHFTMGDENGYNVEIYLSDIGGSSAESTEIVQAIANKIGESFWKEYMLSEGTWVDTGIAYADDPVQGGVIAARVVNSTSQSINNVSVNTMGLPDIQEIGQVIESKKNELLNKLYDKVGINPSVLSDEDKLMLATGVAFSIDDNVCFGAIQWVLSKNPPDDNYYYLKAKAYSDAAFTAAYTIGTVGSAAEALRALETAGAAGAMAIAASPTGMGSVALGTAAVAELAEAGVMTGVSFISSKMAQRSQGILQSTVTKLKETIGYKTRIAIENAMSKIKTSSICEKTAKELNKFWEIQGYANPPYMDETIVKEFTLAEKTKFVRVYDKETSGMRGNWIMNAEDIAGLTAEQIKDKYALQNLPKYICDVEVDAGVKMHCGVAGEITGWGKGGGIQFDLNADRTVGSFFNERLIQ